MCRNEERFVFSQVYLENPKEDEGEEDDPAIMTSHIIRAPPMLCAQVTIAQDSWQRLQQSGGRAQTLLLSEMNAQCMQRCTQTDWLGLRRQVSEVCKRLWCDIKPGCCRA